MKHDQAKKLIDEYADSRLPADIADEVKKHLDECRECSDMAGQIQDLLMKIKMLPEKISPPHDLWKDVFHQIHDLKVVQIKKEEAEEPPEEEVFDEKEERIKEDARKEIAKKREQKEKEEKKREKESKGIRLYNFEEVFKKNKLAVTIAGSIILVVIAVIIIVKLGSNVPWQLSGVQGQYKVNGKLLAGGELNNDDILETFSNSVAIMIPEMGQVSLNPWSKIQKKGSYNFSLSKGDITAENKNAAESFIAQVFTSEIKCTGSGVTYKVKINNNNTAELNVSKGRAIVTGNKLESVVTPGFVCRIREKGPEIPISLNSSEETKKAYELLSYYNDQDALNEVLNLSGLADGISLWHLLKRITGDNRGAVFNKLYSLYSPPKGVDQESILRLKEEALNKWFNQILTSM
ncbi:MAG: anti-sigma factor family protein [Ignavibacteria bacterium]